MYRGMSGAGTMTAAECAASSICSPIKTAWCYSGGYFTPDCNQWRSGIFNPPAVAAPALSTNPATYGQPIGPDGQVVTTPAEAQALVDAQIAAAQAAMVTGAQGQLQESTVGNIYSDAAAAIPTVDTSQFLPMALVIAGVAVFMMVKN